MWKSEFAAETAAPPEAVWRVLEDADRWPSWNPGLTAAHLDGPLASGATGSVTLTRGGTRPFVVYAADPGRYFAYGGNVPGGRQAFWYRIEGSATGQTRVMLGHTIEGLLWPVFGLLFGRFIRGYLPTALKQLVATAEGR